jgi:hypothetical protein
VTVRKVSIKLRFFFPSSLYCFYSSQRLFFLTILLFRCIIIPNYDDIFVILHLVLITYLIYIFNKISFRRLDLRRKCLASTNVASKSALLARKVPPPVLQYYLEPLNVLRLEREKAEALVYST